jgi:hypothetical protein
VGLSDIVLKRVTLSPPMRFKKKLIRVQWFQWKAFLKSNFGKKKKKKEIT